MTAFFFANLRSDLDAVCQWQIESRAPGDWRMMPWESFAIRMIGYQLCKIEGKPHKWFMIGNSVTPDPIGFLGPGENSVMIWLPPGYYQPFPQRNTPNAYLDIHGSSRGFTKLALTVYYTCPEGQHPDKRAT